MSAWTSTASQTLGMREVGDQWLFESMKDALRDKQKLLLLDDFEQVIAAAPALAEILISCPQVKILVTSREVLRLSGEHELPVSPLALTVEGESPAASAPPQRI
jgi:predicted ATPase